MITLAKLVSLVVVDEGSDEWITDQDDATSMANTVLDDRGTTSSVYAINLPPWYGRSAVLAMMEAIGQQRLVADRARFSVGELRTYTWKLTGPEAAQLVGHLLRSTDGDDSPVHIIAAQDFSARRGSRKPRNAARREPQRPPPAHEMMDLDSTKFMKHIQ